MNAAVCWSSCLRCLRRFSFPLCAREHPLLCPTCADLLPAAAARLGRAVDDDQTPAEEGGAV